MSSNRLRLTLTVVALVLATRVYAREKYDVTIENNVAMKTRDGVKLNADIYRPKAEGKFPVLLERTPYDKHRMTYGGVGFGVKAASHGYVYIIQDCRGRFTSEGEWYPFKYESRMAMIRWNGRLHSLMPTAKSAWWACLTSVSHRC